MAARKAVEKLLARAAINSSPLQSSSIFSQISFTSSPICRPSFGRFLETWSQVNCISSPKPNVLPLVSLEFVKNRFPRESILGRCPPWNVKNEGFHSLGDERLPKRRPCMKKRNKRAYLRPKGPYYWIQYTPGEPIPHSRPNEGSVRGRNHRKRMEQRAAFRSGEAQKRKDQLAGARRRKAIKKIESKMAAVARERAWAERLVQLQQAEAESGRTTA